MHIQRVAVIGAGTMGNGIAHVFALGGIDVALVDVPDEAVEAGVTMIRKNLGRQVDKDVISQAEAGEALDLIHTSTDLEKTVSNVDLVVEAVSERAEVKADVFRSIDAAAPPDAILASNTSSIAITWIAAQTQRPSNVIGMHFFNPVPVMKRVEIVRGLETSDAVFNTVRSLSERLGKSPVEVSDYPGFVSNRVLMPMINEAVYCVMEGVASVEDIDHVMKLGMAHPMGPLNLADFIGLDVCLSIMEVLHTQLGDDKYRPCPLLRKMVTAGRLGRKSGHGFYTYN